MARERYLLDKQESTIHANQIVPTTAKEKRANWWFHYKWKLISGILLGAVLISIVWSVVGREKPDYTVTIATEFGFPSELLVDLEPHFEQFADDRNGDGKVHVAVQHCLFNVNGTASYNANELQASFVRFAADATTGDSMIFFFDQTSYEYLLQDGLEGFFEPGNESGDGYLLWSDLESLKSLELVTYQHDGANAPAVQKVLGELNVAMRTEKGDAFKDAEVVAYREDCIAYFERLKTGTVPTTE